MPVLAPVHHVGTLAQEDIAERGMAAVGRAGQHHEIAVNLAGEQHCIPVKGNKGVLQPYKLLEVSGLGHTDGSPIEILAPDDIIGVLHLHQPGVIGIMGHERIALFIHEGNLILLNVPVDGVFASPQIDIGNAVGLFSPEHADKFIAIGHHCAVENTGHTLHGVTADNGVLGVSPDRSTLDPFGLLLPGDILHGRGYHLNIAHRNLTFSFYNLIQGHHSRKACLIGTVEHLAALHHNSCVGLLLS